MQQTLAQTWKQRRDSDHADLKRLIETVALHVTSSGHHSRILGLATRFAAVQTSHQFSVP